MLSNDLEVRADPAAGAGFISWPLGLSGMGRAWREFGILGSGQALTVAGAIVATRVLTGLLAPAAYGELALALTIAVGCSLIGSGPVGNAVGRFYAVANEKRILRAFFRAVLTLYGQYHLAVCGLALGVLLVYRRGVAPSGLVSLSFAAIVLSAIQGAAGMLDAMQNAARHRLVVAWHQAAGQWLRLLGAALFILWFGAKASSALWGYVGASVLVLSSQFLFFKLRLARGAAVEAAPQEAEIRSMARNMRDYTNPFVTFAAITWLQQSSDRWLLALFQGPGQVGLYQSLNQVGYSPLIQLYGLVGAVVAPVLYLRAGDGTDHNRVRSVRESIRQLSALMFLGTIAAAGFLWLFGTRIFAVVVAAQYRSVARYLPLTTLAGGLFATGQMLANDVMVQMNSKALIAPKIGAALVEVGLDYLGSRAYGLPGVVWSGLISAGVYALWMLVVASRKSDLRRAMNQPELSGAPDGVSL